MSAAKKRGVDFGAIAARQMTRDAAVAAKGPDRFERAAAALSGPSSTVDVDDIVARHESTREIDPGHVRSLAESIAALGLIEPIVVDLSKRLLAGEHRLEAVKLLRVEQPEVFARWFPNGVPVRTMDFDADVVPARALEVEIAENEHRRDYTSAQIRELAARLRSAGYRDTVGRPKAGEKALGPAIEVIVGKSMKTIRKLMAESESEGAAAGEKGAEQPLAKVRRALEKQRPLVPSELLVHLDALVNGIDRQLEAGQAGRTST